MSSDAQGIVDFDSYRDLPMQRLPQSYKSKLRNEVWNLSENSAGVSISFLSNTSEMAIKWSLKNDIKMSHMTDVGIKGIDLYRKKVDKWAYLSTGIPSSKDNKRVFFRGISRKKRVYRIHLPLYETLTNIQICVNNNAEFKSIKSKDLPIVFYGTSITQGGCASRPGIAHTNIISRHLDLECINLGFSGNGHLEKSIGKVLSRIKAKLYVIECLANVNRKKVQESTIPLIRSIRENSSDQPTPILFFEQCLTNLHSLDQNYNRELIDKNIELKKQINLATLDGEKNLYIIKQDGCFDQDSEPTVDGIHFNDLGFHLYAHHFLKFLNELNILSS